MAMNIIRNRVDINDMSDLDLDVVWVEYDSFIEISFEHIDWDEDEDVSLEVEWDEEVEWDDTLEGLEEILASQIKWEDDLEWVIVEL